MPEHISLRELFLNKLLFGYFISSCLLSLLRLFWLLYINNIIFDGFLLICLIIALTSLLLFKIAQLGYCKITQVLFVLFLSLTLYFLVYKYGIHNPIVLLLMFAGHTIFRFVVELSRLFLTITFNALIIFLISYLQDIGFISVSLIQQPSTLRIIVIFYIILANLTLVSFVFNRKAEKILSKEVECLNIKIQEQITDLEELQVERMLQYTKLADYERIATSILHDICGNLTIISLVLEYIQDQATTLGDIKNSANRAIHALTKTENLIDILRNQFQQSGTQLEFCLYTEIKRVLNILDSKLTHNYICVTLQVDSAVTIYGYPFKFYQLVYNLLINAIESYTPINTSFNKSSGLQKPAQSIHVKEQTIIGNAVPNALLSSQTSLLHRDTGLSTDLKSSDFPASKIEPRQIALRIKNLEKTIVMIITDFGIGIPNDILPKIFNPLFSTKPYNKGMGIGLTICKMIAEKDFKGKIFLKSTAGVGTTFWVVLAKH